MANKLKHILANESGNITITGSAAITGTVTAGVIGVDSLTFNGTEIDSSGSLQIDAAADITIDAGGGDIILSDDATIFGTFSKSGNDLQLRSRISDGDLLLRGVDGGVTIDALKLDMSNGGAATFAGYVSTTALASPDGTQIVFPANSGYVGIGTTSIDEKLQVEEGNIKIEGGTNSSTVGLIIAHGGQTGNTTNLVQNSSSSRGHLYTTDRNLRIEAGSSGGTGTGETLDFWVNGSERMMIDTTGKVQFNNYGSTSNTGTPTYLLGTDASGNIVKTNTVPGSAVGPYLPLAGGTLSSATSLLLTLNPTGGSYGGIHFQYGGVSKGMSVYNSSHMYYGGESGTGTRLQANGQVGLTINTSLNTTLVGTLAVSGTGDSYFTGNLGIGVTSPFSKLQVGGHTFTGANGMYQNARVGVSNHGNLTGMMLASTYNATTHPEYGLVFVQGPSTSSYNVWSISPDGPAKGDSLSFVYGAQATNIHDITPKVVFDGNGNVGIGATSKTWVPSQKLDVQGTILVNNEIQFVDANMRIFRSSNDMRLRTGGSDRIAIDSTGNVGIGLTSPNAKLHVSAGVSNVIVGPAVRITKGATNVVGNIRYDTLVIEANDVPTIRFGESDGTVSTIMSGDSNLRINSTSPIKFYTAGTTTGEGHGGQGGTLALTLTNSQNATFAGTITATGGTSTQWNTAYTYSQVGHLPLAGGTLTGAIRLNDSVQLQLGSSNDALLMHNGSHTYFVNGTGNLYIQASTGNIDIENLTDDADIYFRSDNGSGGTTAYFYLDGSETITRFPVGIRFEDNIKANFGASNDLEIYHDGSNSYIKDSGTGELLIRSNLVAIQNAAGTENMAKFDDDAGVKLFFNDSQKFETTATGINVVGTVQADNLTMLDSEYIRLGNSNDLQIYHDGSHSYITNTGGETFIKNGDDLSIQDTDGTNRAIFQANAQKLYYDGSLKFETSSTGVAITGNLDSPQISVNDYISHNGDSNTYFGFPTADTINLTTAGAERMRITSGGNVGLGTTAPAAKLDVRGTLRFDQDQDTGPGGNTGVGEIANLIGDAGPDDTALGTPNKWLKINLSGNDYLIPAYSE